MCMTLHTGSLFSPLCMFEAQKETLENLCDECTVT